MWLIMKKAKHLAKHPSRFNMNVLWASEVDHRLISGISGVLLAEIRQYDGAVTCLETTVRWGSDVLSVLRGTLAGGR